MMLRLGFMLILLLMSPKGPAEQTATAPIEADRPEFYSEHLTLQQQEAMTGVSYHEGAPVTFDALRVLHITYVDFNGEDQVGEMVVNAAVAEEVLEIFRTLYEARYPIDRMETIEVYDGDDERSMEADNTSGFNHRVVAGSKKLSLHAYGLAIDINPLENPYVTSEGVFPPEGKNYLDRSAQTIGMILKGDVCYEAFISHGWQWGGDFNSVKDYQHFQKK